MKIVICPDKFKGSLTASEVIHHASKGILRSLPSAEIKSLPLADGGEGSLDVIQSFVEIDEVKVKVKDPLFRDIEASYYIDKKRNAFVEMAYASGLQLLKEDERNCMFTTTYGTGQLIKHAIENNAKKVYLFVGGSATCDGGMGMANALGYKFLDQSGNEVKPIGFNLSKVNEILPPDSIFERIEVLVDVQNPFYGKTGAAHVFAPQKGANEDEVAHLDAGLKHFARLIDKLYGINLQGVPGSGAAGGIAGGTHALFNGTLSSGIEFFIKHDGIEEAIKNCDLVLSGEGRVDDQTWGGKVISGVLDICKKYQKPLVIVCGICLAENKHPSIKDIIELQDSTLDKKTAIAQAGELMEKRLASYFDSLK